MNEPATPVVNDKTLSRARIIACGAIAREIMAVCEANQMAHIDLDCLPAIWHNTPEKIGPGLREKIAVARAEGIEDIYIGFAECGTRGEIDRICQEENLQRLPGPHCYAFYSGVEAFLTSAEHEFTAFYLTDLICRQFEAFIVEPMKLDKHPELIEMFFGNYEKIVYLAQTNDEALDAKAKAAATFLGLAYERRFTGYGDLKTAIQSRFELS